MQILHPIDRDIVYIQKKLLIYIITTQGRYIDRFINIDFLLFANSNNGYMYIRFTIVLQKKLLHPCNLLSDKLILVCLGKKLSDIS